jgi:thiol-disulfide isomerase/thioredoxin
VTNIPSYLISSHRDANAGVIFVMPSASFRRLVSALNKPVTMGQVIPESSLALEDEGPMPDLGGDVGWLNSGPLNSDSLRGKVVLVDIWTYSCINSLRQLPYLKNWAMKYMDAGLVVIGVHSPEFGFEKDRTNVEGAVHELELVYPIAVDSNHDIWNAFNNEYWPADYIIDGKGRTRYHHFGEGEYDQSERVIQELLRENGASRIGNDLVNVRGEGIEAPYSMDVQSPETYAGYLRTENFASHEEIAPDSTRSYNLPNKLALNKWALGGSWCVASESSKLQSPHGKIVFRFHARDLHMVLGPDDSGKPIHFVTRLDGEPPNENHGIDCNPDGSGKVQSPRLYQMIRQRDQRVMDRTFEIEFLDSGVRAYSFTFG